jgi:hypothetical protein
MMNVDMMKVQNVHHFQQPLRIITVRYISAVAGQKCVHKYFENLSLTTPTDYANNIRTTAFKGSTKHTQFV